MRNGTISLALLLVVMTVPIAAYSAGVALQVDTASLVWVDAPASLPSGAKMAVLDGDPYGPGLYTIRLDVPAGATFESHWHPYDVRVTVISGSLEYSEGADANTATPRRLGTGDFVVVPQRVSHRVWFASKTILQLTGTGPWETHVAEPSPVAATKADVRIVSIKPAEGTVVHDVDEIEVDVEYSIEPFRPSTFQLLLVFASVKNNQWIGAPMVVESGDLPTPVQLGLLTEARGRVTLRARPADLSGVRTGPLAKPVRVRVLLNEFTSPVRSRTIAETESVTFAGE